MENNYERFLIEEKYLSLFLIAGAFVLWPDIPTWSTIAMALFVGWRLLTEYFQWKIPSKWMTGALSILFLFITLYSFKTLIGKDSATSFLVALCGLKILEYREEIEKKFILLLGIFLVTSKFLFSYDLIFTLLGFWSLIVYIRHFLPSKKVLPEFKAFPFLARNLLLALPLTAFLYFFFPRLTQGLMQIQGFQGSFGVSGFSDEIGPGTISKLIQSDELAFRAEIFNPQIKRNELYWRGQVLTIPHGLTWKRDRRINLESIASRDETTWDYKVTLEPHGQNWIFTLDPLGEVSSDVDLLKNSDFQIVISKPMIEKRISYLGSRRVTSEPAEKVPPQEKIQFSSAIQNLARQLQSSDPTAEKFADQLLEYFQKQEFKYTLNPEDQGTLTLDKFVFESKKGFCEHFASASALLFQAAGFKSRVIIGYQGGTYNKLGGFWNVQQKDAHAWVEYLNSKNYWTRFDATSVVEPLRLEVGATNYMDFKNQILQGADLESLRSRFDKIGPFENISFTFENWNYKWNTLLLDFNLEKQKEILQSLNLSLENWGLFTLIVCLALTLGLNFFLSRFSKVSDHEHIFQLMNKQFRKYHLQCRPQEGPLEWKQRTEPHFQQQTHNLLFQLYIGMTYQNQIPRSALHEAKKLIQSLKYRSQVQ